MARRTKPLLVDYLGKPLAYSSDFFQSGSVNQRRENPWRYYNSNADTTDLVGKASLDIVRSASRYLYGNVDIIRGALREEARYSFPLHARYRGADRDWAKKVGEPWLYEWRKSSDFRGGPYDATINAQVRMIGYKTDGDFFRILTMDESEYPKTQSVRGHRVGTRELGSFYKEGQYKGKRAVNGIVQDDYGRTIAVQVLGNKPEDDQFVPAQGIVHTFRPDYSDQGRGIPHLVASILPFIKVHKLHESELRAHQAQSRFAITQHNETGEVDTAAGAVQDGGSLATSISTETLEDGLIQYVKASTGSHIELMRPDRPGGSSQQFWDTIIRGALYGIEWDPDFALALKAPGGAWARTIITKINRAILANACVEAQAQRREDWYALNLAIAKGRIPGPKDGDTWSWEYQLAQPLISADSGNDAAAKRESYKLGTLTLRNLLGEQGEWWIEHRDDREEETDDLMTRAERLQLKHPLWTLAECADRLEQWNPNGSAAASAPPAPASEDSTDAKPKDKTNDTTN